MLPRPPSSAPLPMPLVVNQPRVFLSEKGHINVLANHSEIFFPSANKTMDVCQNNGTIHVQGMHLRLRIQTNNGSVVNTGIGNCIVIQSESAKGSSSDQGKQSSIKVIHKDVESSSDSDKEQSIPELPFWETLSAEDQPEDVPEETVMRSDDDPNQTNFFSHATNKLASTLGDSSEGRISENKDKKPSPSRFSRNEASAHKDTPKQASPKHQKPLESDGFPHVLIQGKKNPYLNSQLTGPRFVHKPVPSLKKEQTSIFQASFMPSSYLESKKLPQSSNESALDSKISQFAIIQNSQESIKFVLGRSPRHLEENQHSNSQRTHKKVVSISELANEEKVNSGEIANTRENSHIIRITEKEPLTRLGSLNTTSTLRGNEAQAGEKSRSAVHDTAKMGNILPSCSIDSTKQNPTAPRLRLASGMRSSQPNPIQSSPLVKPPLPSGSPPIKAFAQTTKTESQEALSIPLSLESSPVLATKQLPPASRASSKHQSTRPIPSAHSPQIKQQPVKGMPPLGHSPKPPTAKASKPVFNLRQSLNTLKVNGHTITQDNHTSQNEDSMARLHSSQGRRLPSAQINSAAYRLR